MPMLRYTAKRLAQGVVTVWFVATATFFAMHGAPGSPLASDKAVSPAIWSNLEARYGLDKPIVEQYLVYLANMVRGDFGLSYRQENREVGDIIADHFPVSAALGIAALAFATLGGILGGALAAKFRSRLPDFAIVALAMLGVSVPSFVFAALARLGITEVNAALGFQLMPSAGWGSVQHLIAPSLVLGLGTMAYLTRLMRSSMLEVAGTDYVRTARAKGLPAWRVFRKHQLRNAVLPAVTVLGPAVAAITTGSFVVEQVFAIPGLGRYFVEAVQQSDYTVIMGTTVFYGAFLVLMVVMVDIAYGLVDPRVRLE